MHANYLFLFHMKWKPGLKPEDLAEMARCRFSDHYEDLLDENNWYGHYMVVGQDGMMALVDTPDEECHTGEKTIWGKVAALPPAERWQYMLDFARGCAEFEINVAHRYARDGMTPDEYKQIPDVKLEDADHALRKMLVECAMQMKSYYIREIGCFLEQLDDMKDPGELPFTYHIVDPYKSLRVVELDHYEDHGDYCAILVTDIHT